MPVTSKTGLLPTIIKGTAKCSQDPTTLEMPYLIAPAPFTLKPFAGVYNPFPYSCSILCNHPTDLEAKTLVRRAKNTWATEGKSLIDLEELSVFKSHENISQHRQYSNSIENEHDEVPEELFRKYTETDSRPITPAPTLASTITKASQSLRIRRCMTPDPTSFIPIKEKTFLVLDLRRSHSQETIYWQGIQANDPIIENGPQESSISRTPSPSSQNTPQTKKKKTLKKKQSSLSVRSGFSNKSETSRDSDSKTQPSSLNHSLPKRSVSLENEAANIKASQVSLESDSDDVDVIKRRGKKRKGKKTGKDGKEGEKEFKGIPDPGETQISSLKNDSKEGSSRPSLTGEENSSEIQADGNHFKNQDEKISFIDNNKSFLQAEILKQLQRQLDQVDVDSELNASRKTALEEALRLKTDSKHILQCDEMKDLKKEFQLPITDSEKWLTTSRVFSRRSARFELPMDSRLLNDMTPIQYVQNYIFASHERLDLYNHVFDMYKEESEDEEKIERVILGRNVRECLSKILGGPMTPEIAQEVQNLLGWENEANLDFRTFSGISAACERLLSHHFCSKIPTHTEDPRHEIERADFEGLERKLLRLNPDERLVKILKLVKSL